MLSEIGIYRTLLERAPLQDDARTELQRLIDLLSQDRKMSMSAFAHHFYPFVTHTLSAPQTIMLRHLRDFKGDLLNAAYHHAISGSWNGPASQKEFAQLVDFDLERIHRVAQATKQKQINATQLAFALMLFNPTEVASPVRGYRLDREEISRVVGFEYESGNHFWRDHGVRLNHLIDLAEALVKYDGTQILTAAEISARFALAVVVGSEGIAIRPIEKWGMHQITESGALHARKAELWLPTHTLATENELGEFQELLHSAKASESEWQRFLDQHPVFLHLLGDYETHRREVTLSPQLLIDDGEVDSQLRPDFLLKRVDLDLWDILDIKKPEVPVVVGSQSRRRLSGQVREVVAQLKTYSRFFDDRQNRRWANERLGLNVSTPRLCAVIGRDASFESNSEKAQFAEAEGVKIFTYDDLHRIARHKAITMK